MDLQKFFLDAVKRAPLARLLDLGEEAAVSYYIDASGLQDSFRYRARCVGLRVAHLIIDDKGELDQGRLNELRALLDQGIYVLGPGREGEALIYGHVKECLAQLPEMWTWIRKFSPPLCHKKAEELVRDSLWPEAVRKVDTVHVRRAVVAAWLTLLRQTTGSCFATAPAILIQARHPALFFKDMYDLLSTGQLKRTVAGKEYSVPLSLNPGMADLQRKLDANANVGFSPGLKVALEGAVVEEGETVEQILRESLLKSVGVTEEDVADEEHLARIQMTPLLAKQTAVYYQRPSERAQKVAEWKKKFARACTVFQAFAECALLRSWEYTLASFCDVKTDFGRWNLYMGLGMHPDHKGGVGAFLYEQVNGQLQKTNREIERLTREYEHEMAAADEATRNGWKSELAVHMINANRFSEEREEWVKKAEAIAGFFPSLIEQYDLRLQEHFQELFDPAILGEGGHFYDDSPAGFRLVYKHGRRDASLWTAIYSGEEYVTSLRDFFSVVEADIEIPKPLERDFISEITTAVMQFIQQPEFLPAAMQRSKEIGRRSPWDYVSGGTMETLLQSYSNRDRPFEEIKLVPHSEKELLQFLKGIQGKGPFLMHSPTHAFIFYPEWLTKGSIEGQKEPWKWDEVMQEHVAHRVSDRLPSAERALFLHLWKQKPSATSKAQFRLQLIEVLGPRIKSAVPLVDSVLYEQAELFSAADARDAVQRVLDFLGRRERIEALEGTVFGSYDLYLIIKSILLKSLGSPFSTVDWDQKIADTMRHLGLCARAPLFFADTNWSGWFFGFVLNGGQLELWRLNRNGMRGFPMTDWKEWLIESNTAPWVLIKENIF